MLASLIGSYLQHFRLGCFEMSPTKKKTFTSHVQRWGPNEWLCMLRILRFSLQKNACIVWFNDIPPSHTALYFFCFFCFFLNLRYIQFPMGCWEITLPCWDKMYVYEISNKMCDLCYDFVCICFLLSSFLTFLHFDL